MAEPDPFINKRSKEIASYIMSNPHPQKVNEYFEFIKQEAMYFVSAVPDAQIEAVREQKEVQPIPLPGEEEEIQEIPELTVESRTWLNPSLLTMLCAIFTYMYQQIR